MESSLKQRIALYISCRNLVNLDSLSKSDPQAEVHIRFRETPHYGLVGKTEVLPNNCNPDFAKFIECDYFFEKE